MHWLPPVHAEAFGCLAWQTAPALQKLPEAHCVSALQAAQTMLSQKPLTQSPAMRQPWPLAHGPQLPPQSVPVSSASLTLSVQCAETQVPPPSHTTPPLSVHVVPFAALVVTHALATHATVAQSVPVGVQSAVSLHATQVPPPLQTLPPPSEHASPAAVMVGVHVPFASQFGVAHAVPVAGQSLVLTHATHSPFPSQSWPFESLHAVQATALVVVHMPFVHVAVTHSVVGFGQSVPSTHSTHCP